MKTVNRKTILGAAVGVGLAACVTQQVDEPSDEPMIGMGSPAAQYCVSKGGTLEPRKDDKGNEYALCHLPDGTVIEEWELYRRDHGGE